jgi:predicted acylesterase/phospholipase RssA
VSSKLVLVKRVLYCAPTAAHLRELAALAGDVRGAGAGGDTAEVLLSCDQDVQARLSLSAAPDAAVARLHEGYFNLLVLDARGLPGTSVEEAAAPALEILDGIDADEDVEVRYPFHRILVLVAGEDDAGDQLVARFGARGVGRILRDPRPPGAAPEAGDPRRRAFARLFLDEMRRMTTERCPGKVALNLAGGGITGIYFEQGALKCLADCLPPGALNRFDLYFGISAGAIVGGMLANGYSIDELMAAIAGCEGGRVPPLNLSLFKLAHLNIADALHRLRVAGRHLAARVLAALPGSRREALESLFLDFGDLVPPPFRGDAFEAILRAAFSAPGHTNDFRALPRPLFVGATDQDTRLHVLFGDHGWDEVPISLAIQASMSLNPAFSSTKIGGRFYEDGGVSRTTNFLQAIRRGADLIFVVDPLVPYVSRTAGYARARGAIYNVDQNIRTISYTRYANTRSWILKQHPEVSFYNFLPQNTLRRRLSYNPLDHRPYLHIWRGAYLSTLQRIEQLGYRVAGDLAAHGIAFDTRRAQEVAEQLRAKDAPEFADFFPRRRIVLDLPDWQPAAAPALPPAPARLLAQSA